MNGPLAEEIWTSESNYKEKETPPGAGASAEEPKAYV